MKPKNYLPFISILAFFAVIMFFSLLPATAAEKVDTGIVKCWGAAYVADTDPKGINVRSGPGSGYSVVAKLPYHTTVYIFGTVGEWMGISEEWEPKVSPRRWVYGPLLGVTTYVNPDNTSDRWHDPSGLVPIYGEFADDAVIIAWAPAGTEVRIVGCKRDSVKVQYKNVEGWLFDYYAAFPVPSSKGAETSGREIVPCENVAAYVIDKDPKGVNIRSGPGSGYPSIVTLPTDRPVLITITGAVGDWVLIKNPVFRSKENGEMTMDISAWAKASLLGVRTNNPKDHSGPVNIYKEPNTESEVVAEVPGDTGVTIVGCNGGWLKVRYDKQEGWLAPDSQCGDPFKECF